MYFIGYNQYSSYNVLLMVVPMYFTSTLLSTIPVRAYMCVTINGGYMCLGYNTNTSHLVRVIPEYV